MMFPMAHGLVAAAGGGTAYRYFRLNISDNNGDPYTAVAELEIMVDVTSYPTSNMTSDSAPSPLVASASAFTAGDNPYKAFDGSPSNPTWQMNAASGWVKVDLGSGNEIVATSAKVTGPNSANAARAPKDFTIEGSNDDSDWDVLATTTSETSWGNNEVRTFTF